MKRGADKMEQTFERSTFGKRVRSMLAVDFKRMAVSPFCFIMLGISFVMPILILVMTTMMDGTVSVDPQTGVETTMEGFRYVWQAISSPSGGGAMSMDLTGMCNLNLMYFALAVFVCVFVADDFRSGYAKNLFAVRAKKGDYILSKTILAFAAGALMILCFLGGAMIGGAIAGLPFTVDGITASHIFLCILSKLLLIPVFAAIYVLTSVIAKQRTWLSMVLSLGVGMLLFMMIPMLTPLDATPLHPLLCLLGGVVFAGGLGAISRLILQKADIL